MSFFIKLSRTFSLTLIGLAVIFACHSIAGQIFPELSGRVIDQANILSMPVKLKLVAELEQLEGSDKGPQLVVVTVNSLHGKSIEEYTLELGRHWGIGHAGKDNGIILLIAPNEREVRIEVGYGLEHLLTDAESNQIIRHELVPDLKNNNWDEAIKKGVSAIIKHVDGTYKAPTSKKAADEGSLFTEPVVWIFFIIVNLIPLIIYCLVTLLNLLITYLLIAPLNLILSLLGFNSIIFRGLPRPKKFFLWSGFGSGDSSGGGGFSGGGGSFGGGGSSGRF